MYYGRSPCHNRIERGFLRGVHVPFRNFEYEGICLMAYVKGMVMVTFLKASNRLSSVSLFLAFGLLRAGG